MTGPWIPRSARPSERRSRPSRIEPAVVAIAIVAVVLAGLVPTTLMSTVETSSWGRTGPGAASSLGSDASLTASASANVTYGWIPFSVQFTGSPNGGTPPYTYLWTFGDGGNSTLEDPTHSYAERGVFPAQFKVTDATGTQNQSAVWIYANGPDPAPVAVNFTASPLSGAAPLWVTLVTEVSGCYGLCTITFLASDANQSTVLGPDPGYTILGEGTLTEQVEMTTAGTWNVTSWVEDQLNDTGSASLTIQVAAGGGPLSLNLTASLLAGPAPLAVAFWGNVTGGVSPYVEVWQFGDGGNGTGPFVDHTYARPGTYRAEVTATSSNDLRTNRSLLVSVTNGSTDASAPSLTFAALNPSPAVTGNLSFAAAATGGTLPYTLSVSTEEGNLSLTLLGWNGSREYLPLDVPGPGAYSVTATLTDAVGIQAIATTFVDVDSAPPLSATVNTTATDGPAPWTVAWTATIQGGAPPFTVQWAFGDGAYGSSYDLAPVSHTYPAAGGYLPTLTITDAAGQRVNLTLSSVNVSASAQASLGLGALPIVGGAGLSELVLLVPIAVAGVAAGVLVQHRTVRRQIRRQGEELVRAMRASPPQEDAGAPPPG